MKEADKVTSRPSAFNLDLSFLKTQWVVFDHELKKVGFSLNYTFMDSTLSESGFLDVPILSK